MRQILKQLSSNLSLYDGKKLVLNQFMLLYMEGRCPTLDVINGQEFNLSQTTLLKIQTKNNDDMYL